MDNLKSFAASISAAKSDYIKLGLATTVMIIWADSKENAELLATGQMHMLWPSKDGWSGHCLSLTEITTEKGYISMKEPEKVTKFEYEINGGEN